MEVQLTIDSNTSQLQDTDRSKGPTGMRFICFMRRIVSIPGAYKNFKPAASAFPAAGLPRSQKNTLEEPGSVPNDTELSLRRMVGQLVHQQQDVLTTLKQSYPVSSAIRSATFL
jgi:hypothetical protein